MSRYADLRALIETHPTYGTATDEELLAWINEETETQNLESLPAPDILSACLSNLTEWNALTAAQQEIVKDVMKICAFTGVPTGPGHPIRALLISILGTETKQTLAGMLSVPVSRASAAGINWDVTVGQIEYVRNP